MKDLAFGGPLEYQPYYLDSSIYFSRMQAYGVQLPLPLKLVCCLVLLSNFLDLYGYQ